MIAFNSTYLYLIVCYAHMKIFLLYMRKISFIFIFIFIWSRDPSSMETRLHFKVYLKTIFNDNRLLTELLL